MRPKMRKHIASGLTGFIAMALLSGAPASACSSRDGCGASGYDAQPIYPYPTPPPVAYYASRPLYAAPPIYVAPVSGYVRPPYSYATYRLYIRRSPL